MINQLWYNSCDACYTDNHAIGWSALITYETLVYLENNCYGFNVMLRNL